MLHEKEYNIITTEENVLVFAIKPTISEPENPILIYDGKNHATFYRTSEDVILLDYINKDAQKLLHEAAEILVLEYDQVADKVIKNYKARVKIFKKNPFTDGLM